MSNTPVPADIDQLIDSIVDEMGVVTNTFHQDQAIDKTSESLDETPVGESRPRSVFFQSQALGIQLFDSVPQDADVIEITTTVENNEDGDDDDSVKTPSVTVVYNRKTLILDQINRILENNLDFASRIENFATVYEGDAPQSSPLSVVVPSSLYLEIISSLGSKYANSTNSICLIEFLKNHNKLIHDSTSYQLRSLVMHVNQHCSFLIKNHFEEFIRRGVIEYNALDHYLQVGDRVAWYNELNQLISGKLVKLRNYDGWGYASKTAMMEYYYYNGETWVRAVQRITINQFNGTIDLRDLPVCKPTAEQENAILQNVETYVTLCRGNHYRNVTGRGLVKSGWSNKHIDVSGRIMIDHANFNRADQGYMPHADGELGEDIPLTRDIKLSIDYTLYGFSMRHYRWCQVRVQDLAPVSFRHQAFNQLVLDPEKKNLIRSLVEFQEGSFADIIENKSGGTIFLLHGEPGTGKTLTAEAISELLQRPLYSIGVSQLGTRGAELESNLREILALCEHWNAIALLDEADIFLEQRNDDIVRNAMVGVFLRTLEYYHGILFLTTNRVNRFDSAFHSRISLALKYPSLDQSSRGQIWHNLLAAAGITEISDQDISQLAVVPLNGRQIKNAIRSCQTYCRSQSKPIDLASMQFIVGLNQQFLTDV